VLRLEVGCARWLDRQPIGTASLPGWWLRANGARPACDAKQECEQHYATDATWTRPGGGGEKPIRSPLVRKLWAAARACGRIGPWQRPPPGPPMTLGNMRGAIKSAGVETMNPAGSEAGSVAHIGNRRQKWHPGLCCPPFPRIANEDHPRARTGRKQGETDAEQQHPGKTKAPKKPGLKVLHGCNASHASRSLPNSAD
jgi:hypothetical protein